MLLSGTWVLIAAPLRSLMAEMGNASQPSLAIQQKRASTLVLNSVALERQLDELKTALKDSESRSDRELHALNQEVRKFCLGLDLLE